MKPAWDALGDEYAASSSVLVADADCTVETELCGKHGVKGYPTIKYFTAETGKSGDDYSGGRDSDSLKKFVEDKLAKHCDISDPATCNEKEVKFLEKMQADAAGVKKQLERLTAMKGKSMKAELKAWLFQRINVLEQLDKKAEL
jgi:protein disulfide-isomerase A6